MLQLTMSCPFLAFAFEFLLHHTFRHRHTIRHPQSGTIVLNRVMFMFPSGGIGNSVFSLDRVAKGKNTVAEASTLEYKHDTI